MYSIAAGLDRHTSAVLYQLPLARQPTFEFEPDHFTDQAAAISVELRHGLRGIIEVAARGTDEAAVQGAFQEAMEKAIQLRPPTKADGEGEPPAKPVAA